LSQQQAAVVVAVLVLKAHLVGLAVVEAYNSQDD
jgi:hypothetical protein